MDIRTTGGPPTIEEIAAVDGFLGPPESLWEGGTRVPQDDHLAYGGRASRDRRHLLLPVLHAVQDHVGWVSRGALEYTCRRLAVPPADAYGVASFYARFAPRNGHLSLPSAMTSQQVRRSDELCAALAHPLVRPEQLAPQPMPGAASGAAMLVERSGLLTYLRRRYLRSGVAAAATTGLSKASGSRE